MRDEILSYRHSEEEEEKYFSHIEWDKIQLLEPCSSSQDEA